MSRTASSRSSQRSFRSGSSRSSFTGLTTEYEYAAAYGEPALSDSSSDEQIARAISESKKMGNRGSTLSRASSTSSWTFVGREPSVNSRASSISNGYSPAPTPTPRYAADEVVARSLARTWNVASVQSDIIHNPTFSPLSGPPLVVRSPSPAGSTSSISSSSTVYTYRQDNTKNGSPLSPLPLSARTLSASSRSPSLRSLSSVSSIRTASSSVSRTASIASIISSVAVSSRHEPLDTATRTLRASLPPPLSRSVSSASTLSASSRHSSSTRASSSSRTSTSSRKSAMDDSTKAALAHLHDRLTKPIPCTNPGCGALIPPSPLDAITFPTSALTPSDPPRSLFFALHARCPACTQNHCRGCGQATGCDANCCAPVPSAPTRTHGQQRLITYPSASPCSVPTHCGAVRALGAATALLAFDRVHSAIKEHGRTADKALLAPLHALVFFVGPATQAQSQSSGLLLSQDEPDPALTELIRISLFPAYAASLLRAEANVGRWIDRAPAYEAVLKVLRALGDSAGCRSALLRPIISAESGLEEWFRTGRVAPYLRSSSGETLRALIRRLEGARAALLRLAGAVKFGPTVQQAHALCDAVLYLLLQDALGDAGE
uniref:Uncharacterized protein n=1 Tax=Mycena chlorophos TaxID=658473 RepID=A0ABQ0L4X4_MYCCL|nr:predicted protein [Mycena chlorophos]